MNPGQENALSGLLTKYSRQDTERLSNESLIRQSFIDPFLEHVLGWDIRDPDVCRPEVTRANRRMDYVFYDNGLRLFVVEAKAATRELFDDDQSYHQALEYAFNADLPFVVLTNFRQWIVLSPKIAAESSRGRELFRVDLLSESPDLTKLLNFSKDRWFSEGKDALYGLLARHKPQEPVDKILLEDLSRWRELLLANLRKRMKEDERWTSTDGRLALETELQRYLDRLIFICYCEDTELENPELLSLLRQKRSPHTKEGWLKDALTKLFEQYRTTFNSDLFDHGTPDRFPFEDAKIEEVISAMRESRTVQKGIKRPPYDFARIPADILGRVYENFIGHIQQAIGRGFRESEDKGKRKKEGIYYTPQYIVDAIVNETVKPKIKGKSFEEICEVTIVDPACGSGSFLIRAYDALLAQAERSLERKPTYEERTRLLACIHGVDLDDRAVQVAKLNLALRMAERGKQLPRLDDQIRHGNSLIHDPAIAGFRAFRWIDEFPRIFEHGGFDIVIGNPPYIRIQTLKSNSAKQVEWLNTQYESAGHGNYDIYVLFVEQGLKILKEDGALGYILPHKFFNAKYGTGLRTLIAERKNLSKVIHFGDQQVFTGATTYTCLLFLEKKPKRKLEFVKIDDLETWKRSGKAQAGKISQTHVTAKEWNFVIGPAADVFEKLSKMPVKLGDVAERIAQGIRTSANDVYILSDSSKMDSKLSVHSASLKQVFEIESSITLKFLEGREIRPYRVVSSGLVIVFPYRMKEGRSRLLSMQELESQYPCAFQYFQNNRKRLENREEGRFRGQNWHQFGRVQNLDLMVQPKILVPDIADRAAFALDSTGTYAFTSGYGITLKAHSERSLRYVLAMLNSSLLDFYLKKISTVMRGGYFRYFSQYLEQLPIRTIDFSVPEEKKMHDEIVELVDRMLDLHKRLDSLHGSEKEAALREIERTDRRINDIVYELYGITEEERRIIESSSSRA